MASPQTHEVPNQPEQSVVLGGATPPVEASPPIAQWREWLGSSRRLVLKVAYELVSWLPYLRSTGVSDKKLAQQLDLGVTGSGTTLSKLIPAGRYLRGRRLLRGSGTSGVPIGVTALGGLEQVACLGRVTQAISDAFSVLLLGSFAGKSATAIAEQREINPAFLALGKTVRLAVQTGTLSAEARRQELERLDPDVRQELLPLLLRPEEIEAACCDDPDEKQAELVSTLPVTRAQSTKLKAIQALDKRVRETEIELAESRSKPKALDRLRDLNAEVTAKLHELVGLTRRGRKRTQTPVTRVLDLIKQLAALQRKSPKEALELWHQVRAADAEVERFLTEGAAGLTGSEDPEKTSTPKTALEIDSDEVPAQRVPRTAIVSAKADQGPKRISIRSLPASGKSLG